MFTFRSYSRAIEYDDTGLFTAHWACKVTRAQQVEATKQLREEKAAKKFEKELKKRGLEVVKAVAGDVGTAEAGAAEAGAAEAGTAEAGTAEAGRGRGRGRPRGRGRGRPRGHASGGGIDDEDVPDASGGDPNAIQPAGRAKGKAKAKSKAKAKAKAKAAQDAEVDEEMYDAAIARMRSTDGDGGTGGSISDDETRKRTSTGPPATNSGPRRKKPPLPNPGSPRKLQGAFDAAATEAEPASSSTTTPKPKGATSKPASPAPATQEKATRTKRWSQADYPNIELGSYHRHYLNPYWKRGHCGISRTGETNDSCF